MRRRKSEPERKEKGSPFQSRDFDLELHLLRPVSCVTSRQHMRGCICGDADVVRGVLLIT